MTDGWLVLLVRIPTEPSRHRVAVWRELRKAGALSLGQGVWAVPALPIFEAAVRRTTELVERAEGEVTILQASGRGEADAARLQALYDEARRAEWIEFLADCGKFEAEIAKEIRIKKFTLAELEEEEQSLDRLRRWHRDLTSRDVFGTPEAAQATARLKDCAARCEDYAELVFRALHQLPGAPK
ncbi:Chromate resistance protein ChrB [Kribbella sp. NPDC026611]|uniref:Chromate resistance protein ChrB n=1 Tax=Kribbella sp. NPDC026611 TaxID=3154911 RepID=UPI0033DF00BF